MEAWHRLFQSFQQPLKPHLRPSDVDQVTQALCLRMTLNNPKTKNFHRLVKYVVGMLDRVQPTVSSAAADSPLEENPTTLLNGLFLVRVFVKHFIETMDAHDLIEQLQSDAEKVQISSLLVSALMDYCSRQPAGPESYEIYKESLELLLVLMSTRMYRSFLTATDEDHPFLDECMRYRRVDKFVHVMLLNFITHRTPPPASIYSSLLSTLGTAGPGLLAPWSSWYSYLFTNPPSEPTTSGSQAATRTLGQLSLLVLLGLAVHTSPSDFPTLQANPFRKQLATFRDLYYENGEGEQQENPEVVTQDSNPPHDLPSSSSSAAENHFCLSYSQLFDALPIGLNDNSSIMLLYMLIHTNHQFLSYLLARSDLDALLLPLMEDLYGLEDQSQEQRAYMILVCLVIITQDKLFNQNIHHLLLGEVTWHKERLLRDVSLGSLLVVVLVRTVQITLSKLRDSYLPIHCLAALGNMSMYLDNLHPYAAHRLIKLFEMYAKRHSSLLRRINNLDDQESASHSQTTSLPASSSFSLVSTADDEAALANAESCLEMVLEILNSCLTNALRANPQLSYALLHDKALFPPYAQHPRFSHLLHNVQAVLEHFEFLLDQANITEWTTEAILEVIQRGSLTWQSREYSLQFTYEEEENAQNFFAPFMWNFIRQRTADLNWNLANMRLVTGQLQTQAGKQEPDAAGSPRG